MEKRFKLTELQFESLIESQMVLEQHTKTLQNAQTELAKVKKHHDLIVSLILDAHSLPINTIVSLDPQTKELITNINDD